MKSPTPQRPDKSKILLRAAYDLLKKAIDSPIVEETAAIVVYYDEADCDGSCLMEDIRDELQLPEDTEPLKNPRGEEE